MQEISVSLSHRWCARAARCPDCVSLRKPGETLRSSARRPPRPTARSHTPSSSPSSLQTLSQCRWTLNLWLNMRKSESAASQRSASLFVPGWSFTRARAHTHTSLKSVCLNNRSAHTFSLSDFSQCEPFYSDRSACNSESLIGLKKKNKAANKDSYSNYSAQEQLFICDHRTERVKLMRHNTWFNK